ncbi:MAG: aminotransferase class V-fold PLP-dependent enzyme [Acidimicrobiales bacterium]|nr:MAG: aminotransferase class V-fold PLP-dependent enzyme [Acidimicrobiales bacterium]
MREHFHVPDNYFLSHSVGCLPKNTGEYVGKQYFDPWRQTGGNAWDDWLQIINSFRNRIANLLGMKTANICPQTNISSALTKILYSLPKRAGRNVIVLSEKDYPTIGFVFDRAKSAGLKLKFVTGDVTDPRNWSDAIDDHTALVHVTHALSNTSHLLPVAEICELARRAKAVSVVDAAQSVGIVHLPTHKWDADFVTGTSVKFLCGGPGACFMSATDEMLAICDPIDVGWFSHETPFEGDINHFRYAKDATKFMGGTPSPAPLATAINGLNTLKKTDLFSLQIRSQSLLDDLHDCVPDIYLVSPRDREQRGGTLVIAPPDREKFQSILTENAVLCDVRNEGFRLSVHGYTSVEEITNLKEILTQTF